MVAAEPNRPEPDPRPARTRDRVQRATVELLVERGVGGLSVEAIAQRSGVAKSSIYRHWPGLPSIILDAFRSIHPRPPDPSATGQIRDELEGFLAELAHTITQTPWAPLMATLVDAAQRDAELRELLHRFIEQRRAALRELIATAVRRGQLPEHTDPALLAGLLGGALIYRRLITHEPIDETFIRQLLDCHQARPGSHPDAERRCPGP